MTVYPNDMLTPTFLTGAIQARPTREAIRQGYNHERLLPFMDVDERELTWDVMYSENNLAGVYGPKGQAVPGDDVLFDQAFANLVDVKASRNLDPSIVQKIRDAGMPAVYKAGGSSNVIKALQSRIRDHISKRLGWCDDAVDSQLEYFTWQALSTGSIVWPPVDNNGNAISNPMPHWNANMTFTVNFPLPANQNQNASALVGHNSEAGTQVAWNTVGTANPIKDLEVISRLMKHSLGITLRGGTIYMSDVVLGYMAQTTNILRWIVGTQYNQNDSRQFIDQGTLKQFIQTRTGFNIETYDSQWTYRTHNPGTKPTITQIDFLKEGTVVIVPPGGPVGRMATTYQETESGAWTTGKMAWSFRAPKPPYEQEVGVNIVAFPVFEHYDWFILQAFS